MILRFVMPILRKAAIQINFYFSRFSKATSGKIYVTLFNFRAILCRQEVRFNLKKERYLATERQYFRYFVEEEQNWNTYSRGLISRSQRIGRDYFLDRILFSKDDLKGLKENDQKIVLDFLEKYKETFIKNDLNVGFAKKTQHFIDTINNPLIYLRLI